MNGRIAITLGDPAGIGPEVALRSAAKLSGSYRKKILFLAPASFYAPLAKKLRLSLSFEDILDPSLPAKKTGSFSCYSQNIFPEKIVLGRSINAQTRLAVQSIDLAAHLAMKGLVGAIVTPPINKAGLKQAGFKMPGHTEYLAELSGTKKYEMMLVGGPLRVSLVTRHLPIQKVPQAVTKERVLETILLTDLELRRSFGISKPRLVVCGLNPHAGERGTIGREEIEQISPAVEIARKKTNAHIDGPLSPDSLFYLAYEGRYDAEICMYHDQGLIPLKMISRGAGVNVTLGLPFVRTSPDHGTGYDIAAAFKADPGSMFEAIRLAESIAKNRKAYVRSASRS